MDLRPIRNDSEYELMLEWVDEQFDRLPGPDSEEGIRLQIALLIIKAYEDIHYQIPSPDPIEAIKLKMEEKG